MSANFQLGTLLYTVKRADGSVVHCTVPVDWPEEIIVGDDHCHVLIGEGYRVEGRRPAALYESVVDPRERVWFCDGKGYAA